MLLIEAPVAVSPMTEVMYRRVLTLLLLPALLLTQWVNANRCLGGCAGVGHDSRPHVHLGASPAHDEKPSCGCKRERPAPPPNDALASSAAKPTSPEPPSPDGGVMFLSPDFGLGRPAEPGAGGAHPDLDQPAGPVDEPFGLGRRLVRSESPSHLSLPPPRLPLYLRTLRLLV